MRPAHLALLALLCSCSTAAFAQERGATVTIENQRGDVTVVDRSVSREGDTSTGVVTRSVNGGDPATREFERTRDTETGTYTSSSSTTTAKGFETSSSRTTVCPPGSGSCTRETSFVGPQGGVTTSTGSVARAEDGTVSGQSTTTRANGATVNRTLASAGEPGDRSGTVVTDGPKGVTTREFERTRSKEDGYSRSNTVTLPNGGVASSTASGDCADGACSRTATRTGPEGRSKTVDASVEKTGPGEFHQTRTRTNNQTGESRTGSRTAKVERRR
jgi:hypothetical protein